MDASHTSGRGLFLVLLVLSEQRLLKFGLVFPQSSSISIQRALVVRLPKKTLDGQQDSSDVVDRAPLVLLTVATGVSREMRWKPLKSQ